MTDRDRAPVTGDVLVAGDDEPPWSLGRRRTLQLGAVVLGLALLAGAVETVSRQRAADREALAAAAAADALEVGLGAGSRLPRHGPRRQGVFIELVNRGPRDVEVAGLELAPDAEWGVLRHRPGPLRAGGGLVLQLVVPCAEDDPVGEGVGRVPVPDPMAELPRTLELTAELESGSSARAELDLTEAQLAYGGDLAPALRTAVQGRSAYEEPAPCA